MPAPIRLGSLEVRLARSPREIGRAQELRYRVFVADGEADPARRDLDSFDRHCDHLLAIDHDADGAVVGTYRLLTQDAAARHGGFYSAGEFEIGPLLARHPGLRFLELGRSCVLPAYRNRRTLELLWRGIAAYTERDRCDVMFGCASFEGDEPARFALPLSFLHHHAPAPPAWQVRALPHRRVPMDLCAADGIDARQALRALPPLIRGYLRLGAVVGDGAVIDATLGTTDVLIVLPMANIKQRYYTRFGSRSVRDAA